MRPYGQIPTKEIIITDKDILMWLMNLQLKSIWIYQEKIID